VAERRGWRPTPFLLASAGVHVAAAATVIATPRNWPAAAAAIIANHVVIGTIGVLPKSRLLGPNITRLPVSAPSDVLALTFDDGPDPLLTPRILDMLDEAGARATFFCIGERVEAHPAIVRNMRDRGHGVENHSHRHPNLFSLLGPAAMRREVTQAQDSIANHAGERPRFFRAPAGVQSPWLAPVLASAGLSLVSWTRRGYDAVSSDGRRVAARLTANMRAGDILLLHDGKAGGAVERPRVVIEALGSVLQEMQQRGLRSEALHTVMASAPYTR
jgi:peptidoglycan/xylan/chitin deacetylase (PgdA/CDA1 family)